MLCIQTGKTMSDPNRMRFEQPAFYLKTREEMMKLFGEVEHALDRTWDIAQRCQLKLEPVDEPFPNSTFRKATRPIATSNTSLARDSRSAAPRLDALHAKGELRSMISREYAERLDREIKMIQQMKFSGYFLIVWDFIRFAKQQRHSGRPRPRIGRRKPGELCDGHHRHRSARNTGCCSSAS